MMAPDLVISEPVVRGTVFWSQIGSNGDKSKFPKGLEHVEHTRSLPSPKRAFWGPNLT